MLALATHDPLTQAGAPCSVSVYASVSVTTDGGDGAQCPGHCRVSPLPVTLRSPLHHSPLSSHPEKGDTDTDSRPRPCARCGVAQVSSLDTSQLRLRIPQIATRVATKLINKSPLALSLILKNRSFSIFRNKTTLEPIAISIVSN